LVPAAQIAVQEWFAQAGETVKPEFGALAVTGTEGRRMISPRTIIRVVGEHYGLTREQLLSKSRKPTLAQPRQVAMLLVRIITGMSYPAIGREFSAGPLQCDARVRHHRGRVDGVPDLARRR
jgi:hypothetical protein